MKVRLCCIQSHIPVLLALLARERVVVKAAAKESPGQNQQNVGSTAAALNNSCACTMCVIMVCLLGGCLLTNCCVCAAALEMLVLHRITGLPVVDATSKVVSG
jgi:hypothetical protein